MSQITKETKKEENNNITITNFKTFLKQQQQQQQHTPTGIITGSSNSNRWNKIRGSSSKKEKMEDELIHEQAIAAALLYQHHQQNGTLPPLPPFDRSSSLRVRFLGPSPNYELGGIYLVQNLCFCSEMKIEELETSHFVLVHGGGFGAWCWYKTITHLEEGGFKVDAIDLTGSGVHSCDTNSITSLAEYVKPLTDFLEKLGEGKKVILVGHDFGGACISYAMELFPSKVAKGVFIAAAMLLDGQSLLDMFSRQADSNDLMRQAQIFNYANGNDRPPTAIDLNKSLLKDLLFNQSPSKDVALASVSMRPIPFAPVLEKLSLSDKNYGSVRRFYIETTDDDAIPLTLQQSMINANPPERVFLLKGSDHSPFFSKPQALHKFLMEISKIR
ncbi:hypothetical protein IFM89_011725 [Coptis chinensis]|uniref:AB hydrolase-1 domain-containing protein n=1 Tax=Coptis chinensis TaxID=261450 RepID=A0A835MI38_9MAGN|nr:hypothetical protein IFM89_011725 [Coptis chinensis]